MSEVIDIRILTQTKEIEQAQAQINKLGKEILKLENPFGSKQLAEFNKLNASVESMQANVKQLGREAGTMGKFWKGSTQNVWGFNGALLSTLFFGMEMQRVFGGALKSIFEGYKKIIPESSAFNIMTTQLSANWEFFKFQLADALATSPIFQSLIQNAIGLLQALQKLPESVKEFIVVALGIGTVAGAFMKFFGIIGLGVAGVADLKLGFKSAFDSAEKLSNFKLGLMGAGAVAAAVWLAVESLDALYDSSEFASEQGDKLKKSFIDTINAALNPLSQSLAGININIGDMNELMILLGVTVHNALAIFGMFLDALVFMGRLILNLITSFGIMITLIKETARALMLTFEGDWAGASKVMNPLSLMSKHFNQIKTDISDIGDAWSNFQSGVSGKMESLIGYNVALDEYRAARAQTSEAKQENTNINIMMMTDALANGTITNEQYNAFIQAAQFQSGN